MLERDPRDPRRRERLAGSYLASLLLHALIALLVFTLASSSSQEGASESVSGGTVVTLEQRAPVVAVAPAPAQQAAPVPNVPRIAPVVHHPPLVQAERQPNPPQRHELSVFKPSAPPNPTPVPQASEQPNPQPTTPIYEPNPQNELPAVPTSVPSIGPQQVAIKIPPSAAPSPVPSVRPTAKPPTPRPPAPTAAPTARPATPVPQPSAKPTALPTAALIAAKATTAPSASPKPAGPPTAAPAANAGVPSPSPTQGPKQTVQTGTQPSPGPKTEGSPGPKPGAAGKAKPGPAAPVAVPPTPSPKPKPAPSASPSGYDINAKLRGLLPHNNVTFHEVNENFHPGLRGSMEPTPPPEVVAITKWTFQEKGAGDDALDKMWVTSTHREGPALVCDGWMLRYPHANNPTAGGANLMSFSVGGGGNEGGLGVPIVEASAHVTCTEHALVPFTPPSTPSP
ncbi:MAG TPA: hypothetical protein VMB20_11550 [Candidatus Acidoferrum sp.]|nr:hypothetical protein [Candidatus Acidoferrum sp.]